jgi:hypothetical protein
MGRRLGLLVWVLGFALSARADGLEAELAALLAPGVESSASLDQVAAFGPDVVPALIALVQDASQPQHVRMRALGALEGLDDRRATTYLEALLTKPQTELEASPLVLRRALSGLARRSELALCAPDLMPLLSHEDANVREAAAVLAARMPEARKFLEARLSVERSRHVRVALSAALTGRFAGRPGPRLVRPRSATPPR